MNTEKTHALVTRFAQAWNNHDIETLMECMSENCLFHTVSGNDVLGATHEGQAAVRDAFEAVFTNFPDAAWLDPKIYIADGDAILLTTFSATTAGTKVAARMVDVLTIVDGKITVKNAFRKAIT